MHGAVVLVAAVVGVVVVAVVGGGVVVVGGGGVGGGVVALHLGASAQSTKTRSKLMYSLHSQQGCVSITLLMLFQEKG